MIRQSPNELLRQYEPPPPPSAWDKLPWGMIKFCLFLLVVAGAGGGYYYFFVWQYRLPQELELTIDGKPVEVRLEATNREIVKYTLLVDGSTHFAVLGSLSASDREFVHKTPKDLLLQYPLEMSLDQGDGKPVPVRLEGHNGDWVKYTLLSDHATRYLPLNALSAGDQVLVRQLPDALTVDYPLNHPMASAKGEELPELILGHSRDFVKLGYAEGSIRYFPLSELTAVDQKLVQLLPENASLGVPYECVLFDKNGQRMNVRIESRAADIIKFVRLSDNQTDFSPIDDYSLSDQAILHQLPSVGVFTPPMEYSLTDVKGRTMRVRIEGRTPTIVKYTLLENGLEYYLPMTWLAADDLKFLQTIPDNLRIRFPFKFAMTLQGGQLLDCTIQGRTNEGVKITTADGKPYVYQLSELSDANQAFLRLVPANLNELVLPATPLTPAETKAKAAVNASVNQLINLRKNLTNMMAKNKDMMAVSRGQMNDALDANAGQILATCKAINNLLQLQATSPGLVIPPSTLSKAAAANLQSSWTQVMLMIRHDDQAGADIESAGPTQRGALISDRRSNRKDIIASLDRIYTMTGQYAP